MSHQQTGTMAYLDWIDGANRGGSALDFGTSLRFDCEDNRATAM